MDIIFGFLYSLGQSIILYFCWTVFTLFMYIFHYFNYYLPDFDTSKVTLKILQARLQQWTVNFQMFKLVLVKAEEPEIKLPTSAGSSKNLESSRKKHLFLCYWLCQSLWLCGSQHTLEHSSRDGNNRPPDLSLEKSVWRSAYS